MVPSSLYLGFAASIIWVGQGTYLTSAANNLPERTVIGQFNGLFGGMFASHQLVGNLVNLAVLRDGTGLITMDSNDRVISIFRPRHRKAASNCPFSHSEQTDMHKEEVPVAQLYFSFCFSVA